MKRILINMGMIIYLVSSMFILLLAIAIPFMIGMKGFNPIIAWIVYPLTLLIMASQQQCLKYMDSLNDK